MRALVVALAALVAAPVRVLAAPEPWDVGVSDENQARAEEIFAEGNQLFSQRAHAPALAKYKEAIALWDHPMIRFNMAVTLIRLDRILEAADELDAALRYGPAPFTPELYQQALDFQTLVRKQLGYIEAVSDQAGTRILLDGKPWFEAPGTRKIRVAMGEHSLVAERSGHLTLARRLTVSGGATVTEKLALIPVEKAMLVTYRHPRWMPYAVIGAGAVVALGGGLGFYLSGKSRTEAFAEEFFRQCPMGCEADLSLHPALADQKRAAQLRYTLSTTLLVGGGAIAITGTVWAILNRPRRALPQVEVTPTRGGVAAGASWSF